MRTLLAILTLIALVLVAGVGFLLTADVRGPIGRVASRLAPVRVVIDGEASLDLFPTSRLRATRIRLLGPDDHPTGSIARLEIALDLPRLAGGVLYVRSLELDEADLLIESDPSREDASNDDGIPGLGLIPIVEHADIRRAHVRYRDLPSGETSSLALERLQVDLVDERVQISGRGTVNGEHGLDISGDLDPIVAFFDQRPYGGSLDVRLPHGDFQVKGSVAHPRALEGIDADLTLRFDELARLADWFHVDIPPAGAVSGSMHVGGDRDATSLSGIDLELEQGDFASFELHGDVANVQALRGVDLRLTGYVDDLTRISNLVRRDLPDIGALHLTGKLTDQQGKLRLEDLHARGGHERLSFDLTGHFEDVSELEGMELDVKVEASDLALLGDLFGRALPKLGPIELGAKVSGSTHELALHELSARLDQTRVSGDLTATFAERTTVSAKLEAELIRAVDFREEGGEGDGEALPFAALGELDADVRLDAERAQVGPLDLGPLALELELRGGRLEVAELGGGLAGGQVRVLGGIDSTGSPPVLHLHGGASDLDLKELFRETEGLEQVHGQVDVGFAVSSLGNTFPELAAGLTGAVAVAVTNAGGVGEPGSLLDTRRLRSTLYSGPRWDSSPVHCAVGEFALGEGKAVADLILAETEHTVVRGAGTLELREGQVEVDVVLSPTPIHASLFSFTTPVRVHGPISDPDISPSKESLAKTAARSAIGAVVVPGAGLLLGFASAGSFDVGSCERIAQEIDTNARRLEQGEGVTVRLPDQPGEQSGSMSGWLRSLGRSAGVTD